MGSKTISIDDDAYKILKSAKLPDESFSDVLKRLLSPGRPKLMEFAGLLTEEEGERLEQFLREARKLEKAADDRRHKLLWG